VSKGAIKLGELGCRQGGDKVAELTLEHQREKITADCGGPWQAIFWPQHNLSCESQYFAIDWGADHRRNILMLGHKGSGHYDVKSGLSAALGDPFSGAVDLASLHERACSEMSMRVCRARRLRCFLNTSPSFASISRRRSRSANSRSAVRTSADRLPSRVEPSVNSSRSFNVVSSIVTAIVFILGIVSAIWVNFNALTLFLTCGRTRRLSKAKVKIQKAK